MEFNATLLVAFISFIVFIFLMNSILYSPINKIVQKRQNFINDNYDEAKANNDKSEAILKDRDDRLNEAKTSVREKITGVIEKAKAIKEEKMLEAKKEAHLVLENSKTVSDKEKAEAVGVLKGEVVELAQLISDKLLKTHEKIENVDEEYLESLIQG